MSFTTSDYDLILVSPAFQGMPWTEGVASVLESWEMDAPMEPMCYTPDEFSRKLTKLCSTAEAAREGRSLLSGSAPLPTDVAR
ncbi:MAG: hypothetical protein HY671_07895 [Chloroflexi bacterium]|nr:hypothetical protein [Chloroflexota bacterium]